MVQVDFYLLASNNAQQMDAFICRLLNKAYQQKHAVFVLCESESHAKRLDDLLWTFDDASFLPHAIFVGKEKQTHVEQAPILLGLKNDIPPHQDILLNLTDRMPDDFSSFKRVIEVVANDETQKQLARERFVAYRQQGATLNSHKIA